MTRLEDDGLISEHASPAGEDERRRYYHLTAAGRAAARAESQRLARLVRQARAVDLLQEPRP
jgi:DNA-binding PadR family transcriptional regulator